MAAAQAAGTFDGNGHTVSNIAIDKVTSNYTYAGFFGYIGTNGVVTGLGLEIASIASTDALAASLAITMATQ